MLISTRSDHRDFSGSRPLQAAVAMALAGGAAASALQRAVVLVAAVGAGVLGCASETGVGDPCIPEDEFRPTFSGFSVDGISIESKSFQCQTRVCLVANFQGRVSCTYGGAAGVCQLPDGSGPVREIVVPQLAERRPENAVYCSCRCNGPDADANYCDCPSGFSCDPVEGVGLFSTQLAGSYCVRTADRVEDPALVSEEFCDAATMSCG